MKIVIAIALLVAVGVASASSLGGYYGQGSVGGVAHAPVYEVYDDKPKYTMLDGLRGFGFDKRSLESNGLHKPITAESLRIIRLQVRDGPTDVYQADYGLDN